MLTSLRKFTVIFLAILQLIAPLVHAHVGEKAGFLSHSGVGALHVPGLERYSVDRSIYPAEAIHYKVSTHDFSSDGMLIGINAGIKDKQANVDVDHYYLYQQIALFKTVILPFNTATPPQSQPFVCRLRIPSLSPRAPPVQ